MLTQVIPFGDEARRDCCANITAEGDPVWVVWDTHLSAVNVGDGGIEAVIESPEAEGWNFRGHDGIIVTFWVNKEVVVFLSLNQLC